MAKKFKEVEIKTDFFDFQKNNEFIGVLTGQSESEFEGKINKIVTGETEKGERYNFGGYQINKFYETIYGDGQICKIKFVGKVDIKGGKRLNDFKFYVEE